MEPVVNRPDPHQLDSSYSFRRIILHYTLFIILLIHTQWRISLPVNSLARDPKQLGNLIRRVRKKLGLSQTDLGTRTGLRQATISSIETGNPSTKLETILAILAALDLEFQIKPRSKGWSEDIEDLL